MKTKEIDSMWLKYANNWRLDHQKHVESLIDNAEKSYPPDGSDVTHPALWRGPHWRWFKETQWWNDD